MSLSNIGIDIISAKSGQEALSLIEENDFFCIILDIMMPLMDGVEVAQKIKINSNTNSIPLIFITAIDPSEEIVKTASEYGEIIRKPYDSDSLSEKVLRHKPI